MVERIYRIGRMKKTIQTVFIFVVLYSFMACTTDHSFMLDEKRQIIVVHNLLILEIESDSTQIDDGHLFFITKKDPYETRITDTIRLQGTTTEISVKEIMTGTGYKRKERVKLRPNRKYTITHSGMGGRVFIQEFFWTDSNAILRVDSTKKRITSPLQSKEIVP